MWPFVLLDEWFHKEKRENENEVKNGLSRWWCDNIAIKPCLCGVARNTKERSVRRQCLPAVEANNVAQRKLRTNKKKIERSGFERNGVGAVQCNTPPCAVAAALGARGYKWLL
jgi:hypothetical protein